MDDEEKIIPLDVLVLNAAIKSQETSRQAKKAAEDDSPRKEKHLKIKAERLAEQSQGLFKGTLPPEEREESIQETKEGQSNSTPAKIILFPEKPQNSS